MELEAAHRRFPACALRRTADHRRAIFDIQLDIVALSRDGTDPCGLAGTHLVERLFRRIEYPMLLIPPAHSMGQKEAAAARAHHGSV